MLRAADDQVLGFCTFGASLSTYFSSIASSTSPHSTTGSITTLPAAALPKLLQPFADKKYILWYDPISLSKQVHVYIALKQGASQRDQLVAWWHALALAEACVRGRSGGEDADEGGSLLEQTMRDVGESMGKMAKSMEEAGWDLETAALETGSNSRLVVK